MRLHPRPATRMMLMVSDVSSWYVHQGTDSCANGHWVPLRCLMLSRQEIAMATWGPVLLIVKHHGLCSG
jgi:hypothetical protein